MNQYGEVRPAAQIHAARLLAQLLSLPEVHSDLVRQCDAGDQAEGIGQPMTMAGVTREILTAVANERRSNVTFERLPPARTLGDR